MPSALLREARRQKGLPTINVPSVWILDPDGDLVRRLRHAAKARPFEGWPCYHTQLDTFTLAGQVVGIVGCAVGAPFAVLVAEELFASGCRVLLSLTSAGQISPLRKPPRPAVSCNRVSATPLYAGARFRAFTTRRRRNLIIARRI